VVVVFVVVDLVVVGFVGALVVYCVVAVEGQGGKISKLIFK